MNALFQHREIVKKKFHRFLFNLKFRKSLQTQKIDFFITEKYEILTLKRKFKYLLN